jgi:RNA polymerase II elongation factor ELL
MRSETQLSSSSILLARIRCVLTSPMSSWAKYSLLPQGLSVNSHVFPLQCAQDAGYHDLYVKTKQAGRSNSSIRTYGTVVGKVSIAPGLDGSISERIREKTQAEEQAKNEKRTVVLHAPPPSDSVKPAPRPKIIKKKPAGSASASTSASSKSKGSITGKNEGAIHAKNEGMSARASPMPAPSTHSRSPSTTSTSVPAPGSNISSGLRGKLIFPLAMSGSITRDELFKRANLKEAQFLEVLNLVYVPRHLFLYHPSNVYQVAEPTKRNAQSTGATHYQLKTRFWRDVRPYAWSGLSDSQRNALAERACDALTALGTPDSDPVWEHIRPRPLPVTTQAPLVKPSVQKNPNVKTTVKSTSSAPSKAAASVTAPVKTKPAARRDDPHIQRTASSSSSSQKAATASSASSQKSKDLVKREVSDDRELGEIYEPPPPPPPRRIKVTQRDSPHEGTPPLRTNIKVSTVVREDRPIKKKREEISESDRERRPTTTRDAESERVRDRDRDRERRKEEKRRGLDKGDEAYKPSKHPDERTRESQHTRSERDYGDRKPHRHEYSPAPEQQQQQRRPPKRERSQSPVPQPRKQRRSTSPTVVRKVKRELSPEIKSKPLKSSRLASPLPPPPKQKRIPNYTSSEDEGDEPPPPRERSKASKMPPMPPTDPLPKDRAKLEQRYKRSHRIYTTLFHRVSMYRSRIEELLDADGEETMSIGSEGEDFMSDEELHGLKRRYDAWANEIKQLRMQAKKIQSAA